MYLAEVIKEIKYNYRKVITLYGYIYESTNLINGKKYIGQHKSKVFDEKYIGSGTYLHRAIEKYGKENFIVKIIEECESKENLNEREIYWIKFYNAAKSTKYYNIAEGGFGYGNTLTGLSKEDYELFCEKARLNHLGSKNPQYGLKGELSPSFGCKRSDEVKNRISNTVKINAQNLSKEEKERRSKKQSIAQTGLKRSEKAKENMKIAQNRPEVKKKRSESLKKVPRTEEWKRKISESQKGKVISDDQKRKISNTIKGSKWMNNGIRSLQVKPHEINDYISQGYKFGAIRKNTIPWNKKLPCGHIYKDNCNCLNKGV